MVGTGNCDMRMKMESPLHSSHRSLPSKLTHALHRASSATRNSTSTESGSTTGRKESVCGQMGVMRIAGTFGCTMDPPALTEYAVDPVAVASITPSAWMVVMSCPRSYASILLKNGDGPRSTSTSFKTVYTCEGAPSPPLRALSFFFTRVHSRRMRSVMGMPPLMFATFFGPRPTLCSSDRAICSGGWFVRKPMLPKWKPISGGTGPWNSLDACRITPSPPRHTPRSTVPQSSRGMRPSLSSTRSVPTFASTASRTSAALAVSAGSARFFRGFLVFDLVSDFAIASADKPTSFGSAGFSSASRRISSITDASTITSNPMDMNACATSMRLRRSADPSFLTMKMRFGGTRHTSTSCCVEGCEILSMRSSTSSRVHVKPSVRITYMSGAWSRDECSPTADASAVEPPLPVPSGALCVDGYRAFETDANAPSSLNPAPSYAGAVSRSSAAALLAASVQEGDGSGAVVDLAPRVDSGSVAPATLYTAEDGSCALAVPAGFVASAAASSAACASCSCLRSVARSSSSSSQDPSRLRASRSANSRTNASCARLPKSQLRLSSASASSTFMPREMRQQLTMLPVRPMPALQCTNIGRLLSSSATSMNRSTSSNEGGSMSVTGMWITSRLSSPSFPTPAPPPTGRVHWLSRSSNRRSTTVLKPRLTIHDRPSAVGCPPRKKATAAPPVSASHATSLRSDGSEKMSGTASTATSKCTVWKFGMALGGGASAARMRG